MTRKKKKRKKKGKGPGNEFSKWATTRKGKIGEAVIQERLEGNGWVVYTPPKGSAPIDKDFQTYQVMESQGAEVHIFFLDELLGKIFWARFEDLSRPSRLHFQGQVVEYPLKYKTRPYMDDVILFPLQAMIPLGDVPQDALEAILKKARSLSHKKEKPSHFQDWGILERI